MKTRSVSRRGQGKVPGEQGEAAAKVENENEAMKKPRTRRKRPRSETPATADPPRTRQQQRQQREKEALAETATTDAPMAKETLASTVSKDEPAKNRASSTSASPSRPPSADGPPLPENVLQLLYGASDQSPMDLCEVTIKEEPADAEEEDVDVPDDDPDPSPTPFPPTLPFPGLPPVTLPPLPPLPLTFAPALSLEASSISPQVVSERNNSFWHSLLQSQQGNKTTLSNQCEYECGECSKVLTSYRVLLNHAKYDHQRHVGSQYYPYKVKRERYLECRICSSVILCDSIYLKKHLKAYHDKISLSQYYDMYPRDLAGRDDAIMAAAYARTRTVEGGPESSSSCVRIHPLPTAPVPQRVVLTNLCAYECGQCQMVLQGFTALANHALSVHNMTTRELQQLGGFSRKAERFLECQHCSQVLVCDVPILREHLRSGHDVSLEEYCLQFPGHLDGKDIAALSLQLQRPEPPELLRNGARAEFKCSVCNKACDSFTELAQHSSKAHGMNVIDMKGPALDADAADKATPADEKVVRSENDSATEEVVKEVQGPVKGRSSRKRRGRRGRRKKTTLAKSVKKAQHKLDGELDQKAETTGIPENTKITPRTVEALTTGVNKAHTQTTAPRASETAAVSASIATSTVSEAMYLECQLCKEVIHCGNSSLSEHLQSLHGNISVAAYRDMFPDFMYGSSSAEMAKKYLEQQLNFVYEFVCRHCSRVLENYNDLYSHALIEHKMTSWQILHDLGSKRRKIN